MKSVIIDRLIQIEESARSITKDIEEREAGLTASVHKKADEIEETLKALHEKKKAELKAATEKECEHKIMEIERDFLARSKKLDEYFEQNQGEWEKEIFDSIIGR